MIARIRRALFATLLVMCACFPAQAKRKDVVVMNNGDARPGIQAVPSYSLLPRSNSTPVNMNQLRDVIRGQNPLSRLPVGANRNKFLLDGQAGWRSYLDRNKRYH